MTENVQLALIAAVPGILIALAGAIANIITTIVKVNLLRREFNGHFSTMVESVARANRAEGMAEAAVKAVLPSETVVERVIVPGGASDRRKPEPETS